MRTGLFKILTCMAILVPGTSLAQEAVKVGILTDMSSIYADISGAGSVEAVKMAIEDAGGNLLGKPIEVISADHQNKADVGTNIARQWYDRENVDAILDINNSAVAFGVTQIAKTKNKVVLLVGAASTELTGSYCTPVSAQWLYDTYSVVRGTVDAAQANGPKSWYFITADYAFGHSLEQEASALIERGGGKTLGKVRVPIGTADYASFLLQAQASKADIIGLALSGGDLVNVVKQGGEFGITQGGQKFAAMLATEADIKTIGPQAAGGMQFSSPFYWDLDDATRAFAARFEKRMKRPPTMMQAGVYSAANHYFKAIKEAGTKDATTVMAKMRELPINDFMTKNGVLRADGRVVRDVHLFEAKSPKDSKSSWDIYKLVSTTPGNVVTKPLNPACPLVK